MVNGESVYRAHKKLAVWQEAVALATDVYSLTEAFPKSETYGIASQMRRAVVSVPSNIAEGAARHSSREFAQFLNIAGGSLSELDTQIEISSNLGYIATDIKCELEKKVDSISKKLAGLINKIREEIKNSER